MRSPRSIVMQSADTVQSKSLGSAAIGILCAYKHAGNIYIYILGACLQLRSMQRTYEHMHMAATDYEHTWSPGARQ